MLNKDVRWNFIYGIQAFKAQAEKGEAKGCGKSSPSARKNLGHDGRPLGLKTQLPKYQAIAPRPLFMLVSVRKRETLLQYLCTCVSLTIAFK